MLEQNPTRSLTTHLPNPAIMNSTNTSPPHKTQTQPTTAHCTTHRRNLAPPHQDPATSSTEPTRKKHLKPSTLLRRDLDPNLQTIMRPFSKLYTTHQNTGVSKDSIFLPKTQIETSFLAKPVSVSTIEDTPMSKLSHQSRKTLLELEKQKLKSPNFVPKPQIETSFQVKPVSVSAIEERPVSKSGHKSRKTIAEIEKQKLRASVTGICDKPHDFKIGFLSENKGELKKLTKKDMGKGRTNVSLSKSQDSGLKVADKPEGGEVKRPSFSLSVTGGGRRSFSNSQAELADFLSCNGVKIVSVDMPPYMQIHAVNCARKTCDSLEKFTSKTLAFTLKKEFDGVYGPAWHCIVGSSFGSFVTHSVGGFMYFSMDHKIYILLFKTTVQKAD